MAREFIRDSSRPFVASQSAIRCLADCERRAHHRYIARSPQDVDYVEPTYFRFGSALHRLCELTAHDFERLTPELVEGACMENRLDWEKDGAKLVAMVREYSRFRDHGERLVAFEVEAVTDDWVMYADAVVETSDGWKLVDLKTTSDMDAMVRAKMRHDEQVNLYTAHAHLFAEKTSLDMARFLGFEYREIEKPRERLKKNETRDELIARMVPSVRFTLVPPSELETVRTVEQMAAKLARFRALFGGAEPTENRSQCVNKGSVCPYWSRCNGGKTYTETKQELENGSV